MTNNNEYNNRDKRGKKRREVAANISTSAASIKKVLKSMIFQGIKITSISIIIKGEKDIQFCSSTN